MRLVLFEPDIPQNAGALIRLGAGLGIAIDVIGPCGFVFSDSRLRRRAGMDYLERAEVAHHASWQTYIASRKGSAGRLILLTSKGSLPYTAFTFAADDTILLGRETLGVPAFVHETADGRLRIPLRPGLRSLNVAQAGAMAVGEALRQTNGFPT